MSCKRLKAFLKKNYVTYADLAAALGMTPGGVAKLLDRGTCTAEQYDRLLGLGLPQDMLPRARVPKLPALAALAERRACGMD